MLKLLRKYFIRGILAILPLILSVYILVIFFNFIDGILGKPLNVYLGRWLGFYIPGIGIILMVLVILACGFIVSFSFKNRLKSVEHFLSHLPFLRNIYPLLQQAIRFMFSKDSLAFKQAVLVEFPRKGVWSLGFIANESYPEAKEKAGQQLQNVYVPLAPNPITGFILLVEESALIRLDVSVKEAMKIIITGGIVNPGEHVDLQGKQQLPQG